MPSIIRKLPILGVGIAIVLLAIATVRYSGDVEWTRLTVSLLCAATLPDGEPNQGRVIPIIALILFCVCISAIFHSISRQAGPRVLQKAIQIGGIGSMVYALLTATPMHNLMVTIALLFFAVAIVSIVWMCYLKRFYVLSLIGAVCIAVKCGTASFYYSGTFSDLWGLFQKLSLVVTTIWLIAIYVKVNSEGKAKQ